MSKYYEALKKENFILCIPSKSRVERIPKKLGLWKFLHPEQTIDKEYPSYLYVISSQKEAYKRVYSNKIVSTPDTFNIATTRQAMVDQAIKKEVEYLIMIDDDVTFGFRDDSLSSKYCSSFHDCYNYDVFNKVLYESVRLCNEQYPLVGLPSRMGAISRKYMFEKNSQIIRYMCYHVPTLKKENISFSFLGIQVMEDYFVQLTLLSKGYRTLTNCRYCIDDSFGTQSSGGCSDTRTAEVQNQGSRELAKAFPEVVTLKNKTNGNWTEPRLDCNIKWKKLLNEEELVYIPAEEGLKMIQIEGELNETCYSNTI